MYRLSVENPTTAAVLGDYESAEAGTAALTAALGEAPGKYELRKGPEVVYAVDWPGAPVVPTKGRKLSADGDKPSAE